MKAIILLSMSLIIQIALGEMHPLKAETGRLIRKNSELISTICKAAAQSPLIKIDTLTRSREGKIVPVIYISNGKFGHNSGKIKVMIFAGQHGNEHSGVEASMLLLNDIAGGKLNYLFERIDLILVPQMNPDGSDRDRRVNGAGVDLNRNHLTLTEPETEKLHRIFNLYEPEATLDIHEYNPYTSSWESAGIRKNFDEQIGTLTNLNIDEKLIGLQKNKFLPFIKEKLKNDGFTSAEYTVGGPPEKQRLRYSTTDINDGRQSFGIVSTFSFIVEGKNGRTAEDNITHRARGQYSAVRGFLAFIYSNKNEIQRIVQSGRNNLLKEKRKPTIIQSEHVPEGNRQMQFLSLRTGRDTLLNLNNLHTRSEVRKTVDNPGGYLIPKDDSLLTALIKKHNIIFYEGSGSGIRKVSRYKIVGVQTDTLEELGHRMPAVVKEAAHFADLSGYIFVPLTQLNSARIVLMFEPQSMSGLAQYDAFNYLLKGEYYPVLRVEEVHRKHFTGHGPKTHPEKKK